MNILHVLAVATLSLFLIVSANAKTIHNDPGGFVIDYAKEANRLAKTGEKVIIDGKCYSACTLFLSLPNACVTLRSRLGFHSGEGAPKRVIEYANKLVMATYPPKVRAWIKKKGGLTDKLLVLKGEELIGKVRICE